MSNIRIYYGSENVDKDVNLLLISPANSIFAGGHHHIDFRRMTNSGSAPFDEDYVEPQGFEWFYQTSIGMSTIRRTSLHTAEKPRPSIGIRIPGASINCNWVLVRSVLS